MMISSIRFFGDMLPNLKCLPDYGDMKDVNVMVFWNAHIIWNWIEFLFSNKKSKFFTNLNGQM